MNRAAKVVFNEALFELGAFPYDLLTRHPLWHAHCREMLEQIPKSDRRRVILDLGCGPGVSAIEMKRASPADLIAGLDLSAGMLDRARAHRAKNAMDATLPLLRGDVCALPFRDASADAITGHSFLYLLADREGGLKEMHRVLAPGGALVLLEPAVGNKLRGLASFAKSPHFALTMSLWRLASSAAGRFTPETLKQTLERAGFRDVTVEPTLLGLGLLARALR